MNNIFSYFFEKSKEVSIDPLGADLFEDDFPGLEPEKKYIYVVLNNNGVVLGVFDDLEKAKINGQKATYYNCLIYKYVVNDPCTFIANPVFEN